MSKRGKRYTLEDGSGNIINQYDTRILETEIPALLDDLKNEFEQKYLQRIFNLEDIPQAEAEKRLQRKIDQARLGILDDKVEQQQIRDKDIELKREYQLRKEAILNSNDCDEAHNNCYGRKQVVAKKNWLTLGLTSEYSLEDIE